MLKIIWIKIIFSLENIVKTHKSFCFFLSPRFFFLPPPKLEYSRKLLLNHFSKDLAIYFFLYVFLNIYCNFSHKNYFVELIVKLKKLQSTKMFFFFCLFSELLWNLKLHFLFLKYWQCYGCFDTFFCCYWVISDIVSCVSTVCLQSLGITIKWGLLGNNMKLNKNILFTY